MKLKEEEFLGCKCVRLSEGGREAVITTEVGPRIVWFGFCGGPNHMHLSEKQLRDKGTGYTMYGGHRLWHAPEDRVRTYDADNQQVEIEKDGGRVIFTSRTDPVSMVQKSFAVTMTDKGLKIDHTLTNRGLWEIELAAWGITVMDVGGLEAVPQNREDTGLLGNRSVGLWPYTKIHDARLHWGDRYITVAGSEKASGPCKIGTDNRSGFAGYFNHNQLFVKCFDFEEGAVYPDFNDNFETYTCAEFTEIEALSPLTVLAKDESLEMSEEWMLFDKVSRPAADDEDDIERIFNQHGFTAR